MRAIFYTMTVHVKLFYEKDCNSAQQTYREFGLSEWTVQADCASPPRSPDVCRMPSNDNDSSRVKYVTDIITTHLISCGQQPKATSITREQKLPHKAHGHLQFMDLHVGIYFRLL